MLLILFRSARFKELSKVIEDFIVSRGYQPLVRFCGHGIGKDLMKNQKFLIT